MGKIFAAVILVGLLGWLMPMCARLPGAQSIPAAPPPAPPPVPTAVPVPEAPVALETYLSRKMFPLENGKYIVSILRANPSGTRAVGARMSLTTRLKGRIVERAESGPAQSLAAGSSTYFGLGVSTAAFNALLDASAGQGSGLEWLLSYRFESDAPETERCFRLRTLPRRIKPSGITWLTFDQSPACGPAIP